MKKLIIILSIMLFIGGCSPYRIVQKTEPKDMSKNTCRVVTYIYKAVGCGFSTISYSEYSKGHHYGYGIPCNTVKQYKKESHKRAEKAMKMLEDND